MCPSPKLLLGIASVWLAGCNTPPPLRVDVMLLGDDVIVYAHVDGAPDPCVNGFVLPDTCGAFTDTNECSPAPPELWLSSIRLERDGVVLDEQPPRDDFRAQLTRPDLANVELVLHRTDGVEARVAIPSTPTPLPTIDRIVVGAKNITATWHSDPPAASALVWTDGDCDYCHRADPAVATLPGCAAATQLLLRAVASPEPHETPVGDVVFWRVSDVTSAPTVPL